MKRPNVHRVGANGLVGQNEPRAIIRYVYFMFIFSLPFQLADVGINTGVSGMFFTLSRPLGYMLVLAASLQPSLMVRPPPKAFLCFAAYVGVYAGLVWFFGVESEPLAISRLFTLIQLLVLAWIAYNLMRYPRISNGALVVLSVSCTLLAVMMLSGLTGDTSQMPRKVQQRLTAFGANPNAISSMLSLGLLATIGLAYGRVQIKIRPRALIWAAAAVLAMAIVRSGSRGAIVALIAGFLTFLLRDKRLGRQLTAKFKMSRMKIALTMFVVIAGLGIVSFLYEPVRIRWEQTIFEGRFAAREKIAPAAFGMFLEKPLIGWGPVNHYYELGSRVGEERKDAHNLYLWILIETGLMGAIPFFAGVWLCWKRAWQARGGLHGVLPVALLLAYLVINLKGTLLTNKLFWIVLAYALASTSLANVSGWRGAPSQWRGRLAHNVRRNIRPDFVPRVR